MLAEKLLDPASTAELLGIKQQTLGVWRSNGRYALPFIRVGRAIRYRLEDVMAFIRSRTVCSGPKVETALACTTGASA